VRAWDVNDNYGDGTVDFVVINGQIMQIKGLMNYPNPFKDLTHFVFQHNHPSETLDVNITVFNTSGARMCSINKSFLPSGSRSADITWDGTDNNGLKLPTGLYLYRLTISTQNGIQSSGYQKLVLLR
jgi:flagellar hook assembly protein FlgD